MVKKPVDEDQGDSKKKPKIAVKGLDKVLKGKGKAVVEQSEAELKAIKEAEEEKRLKEAEVARKRAEEAARAAYKPKIYTDEEKQAWDQYKEEIEQLFAQIIMRQSNQAKGDEAKDQDGDDGAKSQQSKQPDEDAKKDE